MTKPLSKRPPRRIARLGSLHQRLEANPGPDDQTRVDQLMIFLENPPPGVADRWKAGAKMCAGWGVACSGASVWRLYRSCILQWRLCVSRHAAAKAINAVGEENVTNAEMIDLRSFQVLTDPQASAGSVVALARIELQRAALELAREKHRIHARSKAVLALEELAIEVERNPEAREHFDKLRDCLAPDGSRS